MQRVTVFQQKGSGERKIEAVKEHSSDEITIDIISIDDDLPDIIDDTSPFLPGDLDTDLVLDFLLHRDLSTDLAALCARKNIPVIASGKKIDSSWASTPPT
jgi:hypothetical protein